MLSQFSVKNFKSVKDEMTFDLEATSISEHVDHLIEGIDCEKLLPISVIYGPNGGGKSNLLEALRCLVYKIVVPIKATTDSFIGNSLKHSSIVPFKLDPLSVDEPTEFELFITSNNAEYRYRLHVHNEQIIYERLDRLKYDTGRKSNLFIRNGESTILKNEFSTLKISSNLSTSLPLLAYLGITYLNNPIVKDLLEWFINGIDFLNYGNPYQEIRFAISESPQIKDLSLKMIQEMNLDIVDFRVQEMDHNQIEIYTKHVVDNYETELSLVEESSGTRKLFSLLPYIARGLIEGRVLVIDELDAKIHPTLLRYIIELFTNLKVNQHGAQLIFTSHDMSTMNSDVFRRDEIWFVAKGRQENSKLYSLVEFKNKNGQTIRKDARYDKQYLEGKYGADPYLKRIIDWEKINGQKTEN